MNIKYLTGDATQPVETNGPKIICHICNDRGAWGAGFVLAISKRWAHPEVAYRAKIEYQLGTMEIVQVEPQIYVANMIGQHDTQFSPEGLAPIRYESVQAALEQVNYYAYKIGGTLHMPRIGCGLAGGHWERIESIINGVCTVDVYVYDFK